MRLQDVALSFNATITTRICRGHHPECNWGCGWLITIQYGYWQKTVPLYDSKKLRTPRHRDDRDPGMYRNISLFQPVFQRSSTFKISMFNVQLPTHLRTFFQLFYSLSADTAYLFYSASFPGFRVLIADARPLSHIRFMGHLPHPFQSSTSHGFKLRIGN